VFSDFLSREMKLFVALHKDLPEINTIFIGGGTPSLLVPAKLSEIIEIIRSNFKIVPNAEITLESNPGKISFQKLKSYREAGVNRISIGAQSFVESELMFLERIHNPKQIETAFADARNAGFDNINIDLMFSVPSQTKETLAYSLFQAIKLKPEHISSYSLIYEPGTPLFDDWQSGKVKKLSDDEDAELFDFTINFLRNAGYIQYEVSNYALNEKYKCKHNLNYWNGGEYLAFGPSAHAYFNNHRFWNYRSLSCYYELLNSDKLPVEGSEYISTTDKLNEIIMLGLRAEGLNLDDLKNMFSFDLFSRANEYIEQMIDTGFLNYDGKILSSTAAGYKVCDEIILKIISLI
jgi:oxygen-independent coproporphyrinogen-3 oxidase